MAKKFEISDTIDLYFQEIEKVSSPLTKKQEHQLAIKIQSGDTNALNELVAGQVDGYAVKVCEDCGEKQ